MTVPSPPSEPSGPARRALAAVLRPLARLAIGLGVTYPALQSLLKTALVETALRDGPGDGTRPSQSRISLMTGVHRKDVRAILDRGLPGGEAPRASLAETVMARWLADPRRGADGRPPALPRGAATGATADAEGPPASFDALVAAVSRDVRPRAVLDEMLRLWLVTVTGEGPDAAGATVALARDAHVPGAAGDGPGAALLDRFGGNLGDHAETAAGNLLAGPDGRRHLERAVFHTHLSPESVADLEAEARRLGAQVLEHLNRRALALQADDLAAGTATRRFRFGLYFHEAALEPAPPDTDAAPAGEGADDQDDPPGGGER
jgi:hypothetical protein